MQILCTNRSKPYVSRVSAILPIVQQAQNEPKIVDLSDFSKIWYEYSCILCIKVGTLFA